MANLERFTKTLFFVNIDMNSHYSLFPIIKQHKLSESLIQNKSFFSEVVIVELLLLLSQQRKNNVVPKTVAVNCK